MLCCLVCTRSLSYGCPPTSTRVRADSLPEIWPENASAIKAQVGSQGDETRPAQRLEASTHARITRLGVETEGKSRCIWCREMRARIARQLWTHTHTHMWRDGGVITFEILTICAFSVPYIFVLALENTRENNGKSCVFPRAQGRKRSPTRHFLAQ